MPNAFQFMDQDSSLNGVGEWSSQQLEGRNLHSTTPVRDSIQERAEARAGARSGARARHLGKPYPSSVDREPQRISRRGATTQRNEAEEAAAIAAAAAATAIAKPTARATTTAQPTSHPTKKGGNSSSRFHAPPQMAEELCRGRGGWTMSGRTTTTRRTMATAAWSHSPPPPSLALPSTSRVRKGDLAYGYKGDQSDQQIDH